MRIVINLNQIKAFESTWPCHGFPDNLHHIHLDFEQGDLVDIDCYSRNGRVLNREVFDGPALNALVNDHKPD